MTDKGIPCTFFDGTDYLKGIPNTEGSPTIKEKEEYMYQSYLAKVVEKSKKASPVTLNVESVYSSKHRTGKVHATVKAVDSIAYKDPHIYFTLTESNIPYASVNGDKVHNFVLRDFITPANDDELDYLGTPMKLPSGDTFGTKNDRFEVDVDFSLQDFYNAANVSLVVFVQDNVTKEVLQSATYPVQTILFRSFTTISNGSLMQEIEEKTRTGSIQFDVMNDGTIRDSYSIRVLNQSLEKWNYSVTLDGKKQAGTISNLVLDSFEKASVQIDFQIPADAPVDATQDFVFHINSLTSHHQETLTSSIRVIESRPPGFILTVEEPETLEVMAGEEHTLNITCTADPYVNDPITLSLQGEVPELASHTFTPATGDVPLTSTFTYSFVDTTPTKDVTLMIQAKAGEIVKTSAVTVHVLRNPDAVPPKLEVAFPTPDYLTNKPDITVSGMTDPTATLTINGTDVPVAKNGTFEQALTLTEGENSIAIVATNRKGLTSEDTLTVTLDSTPPPLTIDTEVPEETCQSELVITGQTDTNCVVTIGSQDIVLDSDGKFSYTMTLEHGWNGLTITAVDPASNETKVEYSITKINLIVLQIGNTKASVNKEEVTLEAAPYIKNGRTMVPIRFIAEGLGAEVGWDNATKSITITKETITISLQIGKMEAYLEEEGVLGKEKIVLEAAPEIVSGRTFVPLRFVSEAFGASLDWNGETREITIKQ